MIEIPLTTTPSRFAIELNGVEYELRTMFNYSYNKWMLDIYDDEILLIGQMPLIAGENLLGQHQHLIAGVMWVNNLTTPTNDAQEDDLGTECRLYYEPI